MTGLAGPLRRCVETRCSRGSSIASSVIAMAMTASEKKVSRSAARAYETTYHPVNVDHGPGFRR